MRMSVQTPYAVQIFDTFGLSAGKADERTWMPFMDATDARIADMRGAVPICSASAEPRSAATAMSARASIFL